MHPHNWVRRKCKSCFFPHQTSFIICKNVVVALKPQDNKHCCQSSLSPRCSFLSGLSLTTNGARTRGNKKTQKLQVKQSQWKLMDVFFFLFVFWGLSTPEFLHKDILLVKEIHFWILMPVSQVTTSFYPLKHLSKTSITGASSSQTENLCKILSSFLSQG